MQYFTIDISSKQRAIVVNSSVLTVSILKPLNYIITHAIKFSSSDVKLSLLKDGRHFFFLHLPALNF